jgi:hypothetical protein
MSNFILVHNYDNDVNSILTTKEFDILKNLFSENSSYRQLSKDECKRMELCSNAN